MSKLAVNVDHIATLRQQRHTRYPDPVCAAVLAELGGADGIVVHLREDRRHIQDRDVRILRQTVQTRLILEMAVTDEMLSIAREIKPDLVTLVPEKRMELTTEGGLDVSARKKEVESAISILHDAGIPVSIFIDADKTQIRLASDLKADMIEIHTGAFCDETDEKQKKSIFSGIVESARYAANLGLGVNAGHGLCYQTIQSFAGLDIIDEFSIGHSIVSRAALVGMERAVREMKAIIDRL